MNAPPLDVTTAASLPMTVRSVPGWGTASVQPRPPFVVVSSALLVAT
jgi:hypothetical protein